MVQAGVYAAVLHYLKAVEAAKTDDGTKVVAQMKEMPTDDPLFGKGSIRADGRKIHPAYLVEVKKPCRVEGSVGLLQGARHDPGRPGVPPAGRRRLPARSSESLGVVNRQLPRCSTESTTRWKSSASPPRRCSASC